MLIGCTHTANLAFSYLGGGGRNIFIGGGAAIITGTIVTGTHVLVIDTPSSTEPPNQPDIEILGVHWEVRDSMDAGTI